jgi:hypothetical protein
MDVDQIECGSEAALRSADIVVLKLGDYEIDSALSVLVCKKCKVAVPPKSLLTHIKGDGIRMTKRHLSDLNKLIPTLSLADRSSDIPPREDYLAPIDHLGHEPGFKCLVPGCGYCTPKPNTMDWHWLTKHSDIGGSGAKQICEAEIQAFFSLWPEYFPVIPILAGLAPNDKYHLYLKQLYM